MSERWQTVADPECTRLLRSVARELAAAGATADSLFTEHLADVPADLAASVRGTVRLPDRDVGWTVVSGLLAGLAEDLGPTPPRWNDADAIRTAAVDIAIMLVSASVGSVFGWAGQQDGRLLHNIVPTRGAEEQQVGASSTAPLYWHTEDAFHPDRAELLVLACVRNKDGLGSRVSCIRDARLAPRHARILQERALAILPDASYPTQWQEQPGERPAGVPTLWPGPDGLCVRYDPSYTRMLTDDTVFQEAYDALAVALEECSVTLPLKAGDIALIDNDVAVHGRDPFVPRFDGTDRWLKRVLVRLPRQRPDHERAETGYAQQLVVPTFTGARA